MGEAGFEGGRLTGEFFELASFLGESEDTKQSMEGLGGDGVAGAVEGGMALGAGRVEEGSVACNSGGSLPVAMGIPYYVACQWEMQQQQQTAEASSGGWRARAPGFPAL